MLKKLVALVAILLVLLIINFAMRARRAPQDIIEQANLMRLISTDLDADAIQRLELYPGGNADEKMVVARDASGKWAVTSRFDAPVRAQKIDEYLRDLTRLRGEFRAAAENADALAPYGLGDTEAFHVVGYGTGASPLFHVLVGHAPRPGTVFMRQDGSRDVYVEAINLRAGAGIFGDDMTAPADAKAWIDTTVLDLEQDAVTRIALDMPDKHVVFEKREKEMPETPQTEGEEASAPEPEKVFEWVVAEGGPGTPFSKTGLDALLRKLDAFQATDVADPARRTELGLDTPAYRLVVGIEGAEAPVELIGARGADGNGYVMLAGSDSPFVFEVNKFSFEQVFPRGATLFELPGLGLTGQDINEITIERAGNPIDLKKSQNTWTVAAPVAEFEVQTSTLEGIATALATWRPADYADVDKAPELVFDRRVTFNAGDRAHTLAVAGPSRHIDGAYVRLDDGEAVYAMNQMDIDRIFVAPRDLYRLNLFDVAEDDIAALALEQDGHTLVLNRDGEGGWTLLLDEEDLPVDDQAAEGLALAVVDLQAADIVTDVPASEVTPVASLRMATVDGDDHVLGFGPAREDGSRLVVVSGRKMAVVISAADAQTLLAPAEAYRSQPDGGASPETDEAAAAETEAEPAGIE